MFAGGGAIPLEAARLGCESHALEYNPVAHLIELCSLVFPQRYGLGLATDVQRCGEKILRRVRAEVQDLYPSVRVHASEQVMKQVELFGSSPNSISRDSEREPVAYIWVRTVPCRKPGCPAIVPLVRQAWLRKKGTYIAAIPKAKDHGRVIQWEIVSATSLRDLAVENIEQTGAGEAACPVCTTPVPGDYVKECSIAGRLKESLAAVVVAAGPSKLYLPPSMTKVPDERDYRTRIEQVLHESGIPWLNELMNTHDSTTVAGRGYGITQWSQLFTPRQILVLFTLVKHIRLAHREMLSEGVSAESARAVVTYLAMAFGRLGASAN
jgi:putative DNA methylase